jgi:UDP-N-acetylmuramyl pentapeptide phosphotransferase/UDP-N-acetylglucosamine-1-phosphate transferase
VLTAATGLLALSWLDDRRGLPAGLRFAVHFAAAVLGVAVLPADHLLFQGLLPLWADRMVAVPMLVWFINLYNFMDGIDGITGVETLSIGLGLTLLSGGAPWPAAIAGAGLGFLAWNWHPARIFLGDSGSVPLGYLLGWLLLDTAGQGQWAAALILPAYYLADATITLGRRAWRGETLWQAHREHFYQRAVRGGWRHSTVAALVLAANTGLIALALPAATHPVAMLATAIVMVTAVLTLFAWIGRRAPR